MAKNGNTFFQRRRSGLKAELSRQRKSTTATCPSIKKHRSTDSTPDTWKNSRTGSRLSEKVGVCLFVYCTYIRIACTSGLWLTLFITLYLVIDVSKGPASGVGRGHSDSISSARVTSLTTNFGRNNRIGTNSPHQGAKLVSTRRQGVVSTSVLGESQARSARRSEESTSTQANFIDPPYRNAAIPEQDGPHRHQHLPSLSDVLDDRTGGRHSIYLNRYPLGTTRRLED